MVQKNLEGKNVTEKSVNDENEIVVLLKKYSSKAKNVISPSNLEEGDYQLKGTGECEVDYKDGNGKTTVGYLELVGNDGVPVKLKLTPSVVEAINAVGSIPKRFHWKARKVGKFEVAIDIKPIKE